MKKKMLALGAMASLALSAQAQLFNWSLTTSAGDDLGSGSGQLTLTSGVITSMTGTLGALHVSGIWQPNLFGGNDNKLPLTQNGFVAQLDNGVIVQVFDPGAGAAWYGFYPPFWSGSGNATFSYTPVPEPGTWAMGIVFGTGAVVTVGMRRRRQANVA